MAPVEHTGVWPEGFDAFVTMIRTVDGDATLEGQRPLCVLPAVYRMWASARMHQCESWFESWVLESVFSDGRGQSSGEAWCTTALEWRNLICLLLMW